jgi:hypothetical protein
MGIHERVDTNIKCVRATFDRLQGGRNILCAPDFEYVGLETKPAGRCLNLAQLQHGERIANIAYDRQTAETGDDLAQKF